MEIDTVYEYPERRDVKNTTGSQTQSKGGSRCLVLMAVCLGLMCVLLLVFITLFIIITAERDLLKSYKNTVEEFNHTIISLQDKNTDLMTEKDQLKNNYNSLSQTKLELETRVASLSEELKREMSKRGFFFISSMPMTWSDSRRFCRDRGADLVIINTEEKQRFITSFKERVWIGLTDIETEGIMKWVDNSTLNQTFWHEGEPNNFQDGNEDCIELDPVRGPVNNWNDLPCSDTWKCRPICEKYFSGSFLL